MRQKVDVLLGLQWGDEGKGKIVDYLADQYDIIARYQGGPNAGHTIKINNQTFVLHTIPSGIFRENVMNVIGNGVVVDPITLCNEIEGLKDIGVNPEERLLIAKKAHLILPTHRLLDAASEAAKGKKKIGSTLRGIGPTYMDKTGRNGLRVGDIENNKFQKKYKSIKEKHLSLLKIYPEIEFDIEAEEKKWEESIQHITKLSKISCEEYINRAINSGKKILAEGAQGSMLDIEYGTYPYVTSSNTITAGVCTGLGIAPQKIGEVIGITKAYCTRVGSGPFPTELHGSEGEELRKHGNEFGATTGRPRRCGWIDIPQLRYAIMINGVTQIAITKTDILAKFDNIKAATAYKINGSVVQKYPYELDDPSLHPVYNTYDSWEDNNSDQPMHDNLSDFLSILEGLLDTPIKYVSNGPGRDELKIK
ncbi:MAG: adenylosuccinate synthase [Saprospiraceae bacterium]